jgi:protein-S-isoprenylcysteine O-methyltransferase Ste14
MPKIPPPAIALAAVLIQRAVSPDSRPGLGRRAAAATVAGAGLALELATVARFRRANTTVNPLAPEKTTTLVTDGPNGLTRHPMYLGMTGILTGHAILTGGWLSLLPVAGWVAAMDRYQIPAEEQALQRLFAKEYDAYCRRVPRWFGCPA